MILTDREIRVALENRILEIDPQPSTDAISSTSVDLTLASEAHIWRQSDLEGVDLIITPGEKGFRFSGFQEEYADKIRIGAGSDGEVLEPRDFLLGFTAEKLNLPITSRLAARVEGKSSLARLGIGVHITAPIIHAGFEGRLQLEICNLGPLKIRLSAGMRVCQLVFEQTLGTPEAGYAGQFKGQ